MNVIFRMMIVLMLRIKEQQNYLILIITFLGIIITMQMLWGDWMYWILRNGMDNSKIYSMKNMVRSRNNQKWFAYLNQGYFNWCISNIYAWIFGDASVWNIIQIICVFDVMFSVIPTLKRYIASYYVEGCFYDGIY